MRLTSCLVVCLLLHSPSLFAVSFQDKPIHLESWQLKTSDTQTVVELTRHDNDLIRFRYDLGAMDYNSERRGAWAGLIADNLDMVFEPGDAFRFQVKSEGNQNFFRIELTDKKGFSRKRELTHIPADGKVHEIIIPHEDFEIWGSDLGIEDLRRIAALKIIIYDGSEDGSGEAQISGLKIIKDYRKTPAIHLGISQLGFSPEAKKIAVFRFAGFKQSQFPLKKKYFRLRSLENEGIVYKGRIQKSRFKDWPGEYYIADFSDLDIEGRYRLEANLKDQRGNRYSIQSHAFLIEKNIFFRQTFDLAMTFLNSLRAGDPDVDGFPEKGGFRDTYLLLSRYTSSGVLISYGLSELMIKTGIPSNDVERNLKHAVDFLIAMQDTDGAIMGAVRRKPDIYPHKQDPLKNKIPWVIDRYKGFEQNTQALAALSASVMAFQDSPYAQKCLEACVKIWDWLKRHNLGIKTQDLGNYLWALVWLNRVYHEEDLTPFIRKTARDLLDRQFLDFSMSSEKICGNFFHSPFQKSFEYQYKLIHSIGIYLGLVELFSDIDRNDPLWPRLYYALKVFSEQYLKKMTALTPYGQMAEGLEKEKDGTFGVSYFTSPAASVGPQGHGLNCDHFAYALVALKLAPLLKDPSLVQAARSQLDWLFGQNYFGYSMMTGIGKKQAETLEEFVNLKPRPGGIVNGIVGKKGKIPYWGQHWISGEYWLPHHAFYFPLIAYLNHVHDNKEIERENSPLSLQVPDEIIQGADTPIFYGLSNDTDQVQDLSYRFLILSGSEIDKKHETVQLKARESRYFRKNVVFNDRSPIIVRLEYLHHPQMVLEAYRLPVLIKKPEIETVNFIKPHHMEVSSTEKDEFKAENMIDSNLGTRWSSAFLDPQWVMLDFGKEISISGIRLFWEPAYAKKYRIQISDNADHWEDIYIEEDAKGEYELIRFDEKVSARFIRLYCEERATPYGYSLYEFQVFE